MRKCLVFFFDFKYSISMCTSPLVALNFGKSVSFNKQGKPVDKAIMKFIRPHIGYSLQDIYDRYGKERVFLIPCGHCLECRMSYRREWSVRCSVEALGYGDFNCFVTLTYDDKHCPDKLIKRDLKAFIKALANRGHSCRFFGCGEYGSITKRPHYHLILFGFRPSDMKYDRNSDSGEPLYTSELLSQCWKRGLVSVQTFSGRTASYVAGYVNKKVGENDSFLLMSRRPGIGYQFYEENKLDLLKYDNIVCNGVHSLPRYFKKLLEDDGFDLTDLKLKRQEKAMSTFMYQFHNSSYEELEELYKVRRIANEARLKAMNRRSL